MIFPTSPAAPPVVCVNVAVPSTIFLSDLFAVIMVQNAVHFEQFAVHQGLTKRERQMVAVKSILNLQKGNLIERSIFLALRLVIKVKTTTKHQFQINCTSIPCQLTRSQRMTLKPS